MPKGFGRPLIKPGRGLGKVNDLASEAFGRDDPQVRKNRGLITRTMDKGLDRRVAGAAKERVESRDLARATLQKWDAEEAAAKKPKKGLQMTIGRERLPSEGFSSDRDPRTGYAK